MKTMAGLLTLLLGASVCFAQQSQGSAQRLRRPRITGIAHVSLYVKDLDKSRRFYKSFLGFDEPLPTLIRINDRQYVELVPEAQPDSDRLDRIAIETDDAEAMRAYLAARGVDVPATAGRDRVGDLQFTINDPDDHIVEIVQYERDGRSLWRTRGTPAEPSSQPASATTISSKLLHVGILVGRLDRAMHFYGDLLGLEETWRGSRDGKELNWVNLKVPDGDTYIEFMLYDRLPEPSKRGTAHHIAFEVPELSRAGALLASRDNRAALEIRVGVNRKRQMNLYDPDGTRSELMEPVTVDGVPAKSSTAPPPRSELFSQAERSGQAELKPINDLYVADSESWGPDQPGTSSQPHPITAGPRASASTRKATFTGPWSAGRCWSGR